MPQPLFPQDVIDKDFPEDEPEEDEDYDDDGEDDYDEDENGELPPGISPDDPHAHDDAGIITLEELNEVDDTAEEKLYIEEWGKNVVVKGISMEELKYIRRKANTKQARVSGMRRDITERELIIAGLVSPPGNLQTYNILVQKSAGAVAKIANRILDKSGMSDDAEKKRERRFPRR
jgi:hypothetical protein